MIYMYNSADNSATAVVFVPSTTVLPAKSDSDIMFCLQSYQGFIIDISLGFIHK